MIASRLIAWQQVHGRHDLPWQRTRDAYRIWLSEIMLQQTRVSTVVPYFVDFVARFPDVRALADATLDDVLAAWSGLGYYGRARNLHRCAIEVVGRFGGAFPSDPGLLESLPGIGRSTAAAIAAFACGTRAAILDANVRRVLSRHAGVLGDPSSAATTAELWRLAERELPHDGIEPYTQGLMDLGATVCLRTRPSCASCPIAADCVALREGLVEAIPSRRSRAPVPRRACTMLVVRRADEVLLEKRATSGVWGGLWSLPEAARGLAEPAAEIERRFALRATPVGTLPEFDHAFTHFRLRVQPLLLRCEGAAALADARSHRWLPLSQASQAPLPGPVKALLLRLREPGAGEGTGGSATAA